MKENIHPKYKQVNVQCGCGNQFTTGSTYHGEALRLEVCNECHPFYTGKHKIVDTEGRVDKFMRRYAQAQTQAAKAQEAKVETAAKTTKAKSTKAKVKTTKKSTKDTQAKDAE